MLATGQVHHRLRAATAIAHQRLDASLDAVRRVCNPRTRGGYLRDLHGFYAPMEAALRPRLEGVADLDFPARLRAPALKAALVEMGLSPAVELAPFGPPASLAEAMGMAYVTEGSAQGGRFIRMQAVREGAAAADLAVLDPDGTSAGLKWRTFLNILERECRVDPAAAEAGAIRAFEFAELRLCGAVLQAKASA